MLCAFVRERERERERRFGGAFPLPSGGLRVLSGGLYCKSLLPFVRWLNMKGLGVILPDFFQDDSAARLRSSFKPDLFISDVNHEMDCRNCMVGCPPPRYSRSLYQGTLFTRGLCISRQLFFLGAMIS